LWTKVLVLTTAMMELAVVLEQTLNPATAKTGDSLTCKGLITAEAQLKQDAATQPAFLERLLSLIASPQVALPIRQAGALFFKNFIRQHWRVTPQRLVNLT
jgi:Importin-beta N-terminal domain